MKNYDTLEHTCTHTRQRVVEQDKIFIVIFYFFLWLFSIYYKSHTFNKHLNKTFN